MDYSIYLSLVLATGGHHSTDDPMTSPDLPDVLQSALDRIHAVVERLRQGPVSPLVVAQFEKDLQHATRELGRVVAQWTYNHLEPADMQALPAQVKLSGMRWRKAGAQTILNLRVILLSGVWERVYEHMLAATGEDQVQVSDQLCPPVEKGAA
ncbi:MAG TPA: hypothetical protein VH592_23850 [Gemmataceae bacterium]|jgi:hypothetical protein